MKTLVCEGDGCYSKPDVRIVDLNDPEVTSLRCYECLRKIKGVDTSDNLPTEVGYYWATRISSGCVKVVYIDDDGDVVEANIGNGSFYKIQDYKDWSERITKED